MTATRSLSASVQLFGRILLAADAGCPDADLVRRFAEAEAVAAPAVQEFVEGRVDSVLLIYNEFKSVMQQKVVVEQLLGALSDHMTGANLLHDGGFTRAY